MPKFGWRGTDNCYSLFWNGSVVADIEYFAAAYWKLTYYDKIDGRMKLRFAFADARLSQAEVRLIVETKTREERKSSPCTRGFTVAGAARSI